MTAPGLCRVCASSSREKVFGDIRDWEYGVPGSYSHWRCNVCNVVQLEPFPDLDALKRAYDVPYHGYAQVEGKGWIYRVLALLNERLILRRLRKLLDPEARVLDVGCGAGHFLGSLRQLGVREASGLDFSAVAVEMARSRGVNAHQGVFTDMSGAPPEYDMIFMNNYIEHAVDPVAELALARQLLMPNGQLVGEIPNYRSLDRYLFRRYWGGNHVPRHTFQFTPTTIRSLLLKSGFTEVSVSQELNSGHWALSIQNYLQRNRQAQRDNPALRNGRAPYFQILLLLCLPVSAAMACVGLSSVVRFSAKAGSTSQKDVRQGQRDANL